MKIFILSAGKCSVVMPSAGALQRVNPGMKRQQHPWNRQGICGDAGPHSTIHSHLQGHPPAPRRDTAQGTDLSPPGGQLRVHSYPSRPHHTPSHRHIHKSDVHTFTHTYNIRKDTTQTYSHIHSDT